MRLVSALLLLASLAAPASAANFVRQPEALVVVCNPTSGTQNGTILWQTAAPIFAAFGIKVGAIVTAHADGVPNLSARNMGRTGYMNDEFGRTRDFDMVAIIGHDWAFATDPIRPDSLTKAALYAQIPMLAFGNRNGFADSTGASGNNIAARTGEAASFTGTAYRIGLNSGVSGETASTCPTAYPGLTKLLECVSGTDTAFVWRRNFGNNQGSITCVNMPVGGGSFATQNDIASAITAVASWVSQLPDSVRPKPRFQFALHIDDGMKRDSTAAGGGIMPHDIANMAAGRDSLVSRRIKYTLGVENSTDTLNVVDSGTTYTRFVRDYLIWNSDYAKFTPHSHAGMGGRGGNLTLAGAFNDVFGGGRNRNCDPAASSDTTLYWAAKAQLDSLAGRVGWAKIDRCVMPPTDDYSPLNINTSTCNLNGMLSSYYRAGYRAIRINTSASSNLANSGSDPAGYHSWQGWYGTDYGDIKLLSLGEGYAPGLASDSRDPLTAATLVSFPGSILKFFFVGQKGTLQAGLGTSGPIFMPGAAIVVNHIRNYGGSQPGWMVVRELDNMFRAWNRIAGYDQFSWAWSAELNPAPITAP